MINLPYNRYARIGNIWGIGYFNPCRCSRRIVSFLWGLWFCLWGNSTRRRGIFNKGGILIGFILKYNLQLCGRIRSIWSILFFVGSSRLSGFMRNSTGMLRSRGRPVENGLLYYIWNIKHYLYNNANYLHF